MAAQVLGVYEARKSKKSYKVINEFKVGFALLLLLAAVSVRTVESQSDDGSAPPPPDDDSPTPPDSYPPPPPPDDDSPTPPDSYPPPPPPDDDSPTPPDSYPPPPTPDDSYPPPPPPDDDSPTPPDSYPPPPPPDDDSPSPLNRYPPPPPPDDDSPTPDSYSPPPPPDDDSPSPPNRYPPPPPHPPPLDSDLPAPSPKSSPHWPPSNGTESPGRSQGETAFPSWAWAMICIPIVIVILVVTFILRRKRQRKKATADACSNLPEASESSAARPLMSSSTAKVPYHFTPPRDVETGNGSNCQEHKTAKMNEAAPAIHSSTLRFSYDDIVIITNNFEKRIGDGGSSTVYYGCHIGNSPVAVKILKDSSLQSKHFIAEVEILKQIHHKNLVPLVGYCEEGDNRIVVYEYMACGSLSNLLTGRTQRKGAVTWQRRLQIALGAATGLEYLHDGCKPAIVHRDVKPANILLDENFEAKIADFGVSRKGNLDDFTYYEQTKVAGTAGYIDPEYYMTQILTKSSDVYSFGVVLFQLITGKPAVIREEKERSVALTQWVRPKLLKGDIESIMDPELKGFYYNINSIWEVAETANLATEGDSSKRPNMTGIVTSLREAMKFEVSSWQGAESSESSSDLYASGIEITNPRPR